MSLSYGQYAQKRPLLDDNVQYTVQIGSHNDGGQRQKQKKRGRRSGVNLALIGCILAVGALVCVCVFNFTLQKEITENEDRIEYLQERIEDDDDTASHVADTEDDDDDDNLANIVGNTGTLVITVSNKVKVTNDNNNVNAGTANMTFDGQNLAQFGGAIDRSTCDDSVLATAASTDFRAGIVSPIPGFSQITLSTSLNDGQTWTETGFIGNQLDTSQRAIKKEFARYDDSSISGVAFSRKGDLYWMATARDLDCFFTNCTEEEESTAWAVTVFKYDGDCDDDDDSDTVDTSTDDTDTLETSTSSSFQQVTNPDPKGFDWKRSTFVEKRNVFVAGYNPGMLRVDVNPQSKCLDTIYSYLTMFDTSDIEPVSGRAFFCLDARLARSRNKGKIFDVVQRVTTDPPCADSFNEDQGPPSLAIAKDGTVYVSVSWADFNSRLPATPFEVRFEVYRSDDCGSTLQEVGVPFVPAGETYVQSYWQGDDEFPGNRLFDFPNLDARPYSFIVYPHVELAADDTDANVLYAVAPLLNTSSGSIHTYHVDIYATRSTDRGATWETPVRVNDDSTLKRQFKPQIDVSNGRVHIAWRDQRGSPNAQDAKQNNQSAIYYTTVSKSAWPAFEPNVVASASASNPSGNTPANCGLNSGGRRGGLVLETGLTAVYDASQQKHTVDISYWDTTDVSDCNELGTLRDPATSFTGNQNANIYYTRIAVTEGVPSSSASIGAEYAFSASSSTVQAQQLSEEEFKQLIKEAREDIGPHGHTEI